MNTEHILLVSRHFTNVMLSLLCSSSSLEKSVIFSSLQWIFMHYCKYLIKSTYIRVSLRETVVMTWMIIMIKTSIVKAPNPMKQLMRVIHLKMRSGMPFSIVENKIFIWILTPLFWPKRWLLEILLVMFHWSGTRMKNILDMTLLGKR